MRTNLSKRLMWRKINKWVAMLIIMAVASTGLVLYLANPFRFDLNAGARKITPVAVDNDVWGNRIVYFKTNPFSDIEELYIEKDRGDLVEKVEEAIATGDELVVYRGQYFGYKGFTAPKTSPITKIQVAVKPISSSNKISKHDGSVNQYLMKMIYQ